MELIELEYRAFSADDYPDRKLLRTLPRCEIWTAGQRPRTLILVDHARRRLALFVYHSAAEYDRDCRMVLALRDEDGGAAGIPARLKPDPPNRTAGFAQPPPGPTDPE